MNRIGKTLSLAALALGVAAVPLASASADEWHDGWRWRHYHRHHHGGDALAAGVLGLAAGAIIAGAVTAPPPAEPVYGPPPGYAPDYYPPAPGAGRRPDVVYLEEEASLEPWTPEWYRFCASRYRTFNPETGTYRGIDSRNHFCTAE